MVETIRSDEIAIQKPNTNEVVFSYKTNNLYESYLGNDSFVVEKKGDGFEVSRQMNLGSNLSWEMSTNFQGWQWSDDKAMLLKFQNQDYVDWLQSVTTQEGFESLVIDFNRGEWLAHIVFAEGVSSELTEGWAEGFASTLTTSINSNFTSGALFVPKVSKPFGESFHSFLHAYVISILSKLSQDIPDQIQIFDKIYFPKKQNITDVINLKLEGWNLPFRVFLSQNGDRYSCYYGHISKEEKSKPGNRILYFDEILYSTRQMEMLFGVTNGDFDHALFISSSKNFIESRIDEKMDRKASQLEKDAQQAFLNDYHKRGAHALSEDFTWLVLQHETRHQIVNQDLNFLNLEFMGLVYEKSNYNKNFKIYFEMAEMDADLFALQKVCELKRENPQKAYNLLCIYYQKIQQDNGWKYLNAIKQMLKSFMQEGAGGHTKINWSGLESSIEKLQLRMIGYSDELEHTIKLMILCQIQREDMLEIFMRGTIFIEHDRKMIADLYKNAQSEYRKTHYPEHKDSRYIDTLINEAWVQSLDFETEIFDGKTPMTFLAENNSKVRDELNAFFLQFGNSPIGPQYF